MILYSSNKCQNPISVAWFLCIIPHAWNRTYSSGRGWKNIPLIINVLVHLENMTDSCWNTKVHHTLSCKPLHTTSHFNLLPKKIPHGY